jgi:predicted nucleic acid-binding protein
LLVDTSVWSLALRRDADSTAPHARFLRHALESDEMVLATALILQELLQGFSGRARVMRSSSSSRHCRSSRQIVTVISTPRDCGTAAVWTYLNIVNQYPAQSSYSRSSIKALTRSQDS